MIKLSGETHMQDFSKVILRPWNFGVLVKFSFWNGLLAAHTLAKTTILMFSVEGKSGPSLAALLGFSAVLTAHGGRQCRSLSQASTCLWHLWLVTAGLNSRVQHQTEVSWGYLPPSDRS